ncbi:MAG: outer membrane protein [Rhizobiaceae bacterium]
MGSFRKFTLAAAMVAASASGVLAADIIEPPIYEAPPEVSVPPAGGWYLRGDIGYAHLAVDGVEYYQGAVPNPLLANFEAYDLDETWMVGGGIGYQVNNWFRVDWTVDHYFDSDFTGSSAQNVACSDGTVGAVCSYSDNSSLALTTLMANAYFDLGNYSGFTPYAGFGIGGAHTHWGRLINEEFQVSGPAAAVFASDTHGERNGWRFAYALHAGASYDLTSNLKLDAGYSFTHVSGGEMFGFGATSGDLGTQGYHGDIKIHAVKAGLRYTFN